MKKNLLLSILFGACFGAGQMYLGMMRKGILIMSGASFMIFVAVITGLPELMFLLPVLWFYAFFDTLNCRNIPYEERIRQDRLVFRDFFISPEGAISDFLKKRHVLIGWFLVGIGAYSILNSVLRNFARIISENFGWYFWAIYSAIPRVIISLVIIYIGFKLVKTDRKDGDIQLFKGDKNGDK